MKRFLPFVIVAAVALITVGGGALLYRARLAALRAVPKSLTAEEKAELGHLRGDVKAPVTIEEFGDFQCPPCGTLASDMQKLEKLYGPRLRVIFRQYPLAIHNHALEAALASEAAGLQDHFWEMHDLLYREQAIWSKLPDAVALFNGYAGTLGLDLERFKRDMQSPEAKARIAADQKRATSLGVNSTPTLFLNGTKLEFSSVNLAGLSKLIDEATKPKPPPR
jgi:protein-disulfide isomerase